MVNYRTFFLESNAAVFYRFGRRSICSELPFRVLEEILPRYKELKKKFSQFQQATSIKNKDIPLDYIMKVPRYLRKKEPGGIINWKAIKLENAFKNLVMRILAKIRFEKSRPSLKEAVAEFMNKKDMKDERARGRIKEAVLE